MSIRELRTLLDQVADTREIVLRGTHTWSAAYDLWTEARDEAVHAYHDWRAAPSADSYAVYRAAQDRADAAQDTLAGSEPR